MPAGALDNPFHDLVDPQTLPAASRLGDNDRAFLGRVYTSDPTKYLAKLRSTGLAGHRRVLDLGCGFGQWCFCLAALNESVVGIEVDPARVEVVNALASASGRTTVEAHVGTGESIPLDDASVDAIFCFGVLQYLDTSAALREMARVLRPGGHVYITGKDIGGYLYFYDERPNATADYDPRDIAFDAFANTLFLERTGTLFPGHRHVDRIVSPADLEGCAREAGFDVEATGPEGSLQAPGADGAPVNYFTTEYKGFPKAWEALLRKPAP